MALEARSSKLIVDRGAFPLKALGENPSLPLPVSGGSECSLLVAAELQSLPPTSHGLLLSVSNPTRLSLIRTLVMGFMAHPDNPGYRIPHLKILNLIIASKTLLPNKVTRTGS